jgi:3-methyladenine DNA glycosylase AlkC
MAKNKTKKLPEFKSLDDLVEFFDSQDLGDFWEDLPEAKFDVNIKSKKHLFTLDDDVAKKLTQIAKNKQISSQSLINQWIKESIRKQV